jgi:PTH1 family peptidyl-tRNA hydrolase
VKLLVGLGNPGPKYAESRHNVGFVVVDALAQRWSVSLDRYDKRFQGIVAQTQRGGETVMLLKPTTFMNLSGQSVGALARYYRAAPADILVVYDDLDLPPGQLRIRAGGSAGGHKGLTDVIRHLGTDQVPRIRIGIGKVDARATTEYVLGKFRPDERPLIEEVVDTAVAASECWLARGIEPAMNQYNRKPGGGRRSSSAAQAASAEGDAS